MAWLDFDTGDLPQSVRRVAVIGFGSRGRRIARSLVRRGFEVAVFDRAFERFDSRPARALSRLAVVEHASVAGAVANSALVCVMVPPEAAIEIARLAADHVEPGCLYLDATGCDETATSKAYRALATARVDYIAYDDDGLIARAGGLLLPSDMAALRPQHRKDWEAGRSHAADMDGVAHAFAGSRILPFRSPVHPAPRLPHEVAA